MNIPIIHESEDFVALNKPAGVAVHRGAGVRRGTLSDWLVGRYPEVGSIGDEPGTRPGIVHRLDKDTSGVMVVARSQPAFEALKQLFRERRVKKAYFALVIGAPPRRSGVIELPIGRSPRHRVKRSTDRRATAARTAKTHYRLLERLGAYSLLEIRPETGRMHQIRVHLAAIGLPIAGDVLYGGGRIAPPGLGRQFLHAASIEFSYPAGRRWRFEAPLAVELATVLRGLRQLKNRRRHATQ